jgi:protein-S-isoprenylcysteine O-methyltransferase Ste14
MAERCLAYNSAKDKHMTFTTILESRIWPAAWQIFVRFYAMLFLPLLAWGVSDLRTFFSHPVRVTFAVIVLLQALIGAWLVYIMPPQPKYEHPIDLTHWQIDMYHVVFLLAAYGDRRNILAWTENLPVRWIGLGIYLVGMALSVWATCTWIDHLRQETGRVQSDPALLFDGPFKYIRHPGYLCLIIYCLGFSLAFRSWAGLALLIPLAAGFMYRIRNEERDLAGQHKQVWPLRRRTSKRLFPFLY